MSSIPCTVLLSVVVGLTCPAADGQLYKSSSQPTPASCPANTATSFTDPSFCPPQGLPSPPGLADNSADSAPEVSHWANGSGEEPAPLEKRVGFLENQLKELEERLTESAPIGYPTLKLRGHILIDAAIFSQDEEDRYRYDEQDGVDIVVARIIGEGNIAENAGYKFEFDYVKQVIGDLYLEFHEVPGFHNLRIGYMKEPISLEQLMSIKYTFTMERSFARLVHPVLRRIGILSYDTWGQDRGTLAVGLFAEGLSTKVQEDRFGGAVTGRVTWLAWGDPEDLSRNLLHLGASYSYRRPFAHKTRFWASAGSRLSSQVLNTGDLPADEVHLLGTELAYVRRPLSLVAEWNLGWVQLLDRRQADLFGWYATVSYFLTGESREYSPTTGVFGKVVPNHDLWWLSRQPKNEKQGLSELGWGAWELVYRYSYGDAFDGGVLPGAQAASHTVGLNWYPNAFTRMTAETILAEISPNWGKPDGHLLIFQLRAQLEF
jgi:phosphate-selective porin OprO/OprP